MRLFVFCMVCISWLAVPLASAATTEVEASHPAGTEPFDYHLQAEQVAADTYVFVGLSEDFTRKNGGNIVNTGFIVTEAGVIVIDSGPSKRFAEQQRAAIARVTTQPVVRVYLTHHHPDHFLGNQVYADVPVYALPASKRAMQTQGGMFSDNMYRMVGDWMRGTQVSLPTQEVQVGKETVGGHELEFIALQGHTAGDLMLFDHTTGVLFSGDLVFNNRAATTPNANVAEWLAALAVIQDLPFKILVPGHGAVAKDTAPIAQTRDYLQWLVTTLQAGADEGMDMAEIMQTPIPERFKNISLANDELRRSVTHLFPALEEKVLQPVMPVE